MSGSENRLRSQTITKCYCLIIIDNDYIVGMTEYERGSMILGKIEP